MERTLAIIKPDGVKQCLIGEIIKRIEKSGLKIIALRMEKLTVQKAEEFYHVHKNKEFFKSLVEFMTSGPVVPMVLEGEGAIGRWRTLMGATNPTKADQGTIRREFGTSIQNNIVHGSDAPDTSAFEIKQLFPNLS